ncbi:MAG: hypothetical protein ACYC9Q_10670 [Bacillota bacterium]
MSHIASYKTKIRVKPGSPESPATRNAPTWKMLRTAIEAAAEDLGGTIGDSIIDYYNNRRYCDFAVSTPEFRRGVGIRVSRTNGEVRFVYDPYGDTKGAAKAIGDRVTQSYTTLAVARALKELNYDVEVTSGDQAEARAGRRDVLVRGVL